MKQYFFAGTISKKDFTIILECSGLATAINPDVGLEEVRKYFKDIARDNRLDVDNILINITAFNNVE